MISQVLKSPDLSHTRGRAPATADAVLESGLADASRFVQIQSIRAGLSMHWGGGPPDLASICNRHPDTAPVLLAFVVNDEGAVASVQAEAAGLTAGWMSVLEDEAAGGAADLPWADASFHLVLALAGTLWRELRGGTEIAASSSQPALSRQRIFPLTAAARLAVESIRRCPFAGACRTLLMEARCNDMLLEFISRLNSPGPQTVLRPLLMDADVRIRSVAAKLAMRLDQAPSLAELAREAGLSETTLKRGFRQIFGTTVFGYLRGRRMEHARCLLASGRATVIEAATFVGYSNPSNFAAAFRQQFGINPKEFQLASRR